MERNKLAKIIIITNNPFPVGLAGTNRILSYCKGFLCHGYNTEVICFRPTEPHNNVLNYSPIGIYNGVKYSYPGRTTIRVASFFGRRKNDLFAKLTTIRLLYKTLKKGMVFFVIFYGNCISVELSCILICKYFNIGIYKEESEHPSIYFLGRNNILYSLEKWFFINRMYGCYSGLLVMTHRLRDFLLTKGIQNSKIIVVPHTIELERFENTIYNSTMSLPDNYVAYLGPINQHKDGILTLVESFSKVSAKYPAIHLVLAGVGTQQEKDKLSSLINQLGLTEKVHYIGRIASDDIPGFLNKARLLVSCRIKSFQNDYSFPTKVIEYLATGKPTVTTVPGDLSFYLKDRVNAFVSDKADANTFASKILEVFQDYEFAMKVAQIGKELVKDKFNPIAQTQKIIHFCSN